MARCINCTPEEIQFLENNIAGRSRDEITELFNRHFGRSLTKKQLNPILSKHGLRSGLKPRERPPEEIQFVRDNITGRTRAEITELFNRRFDYPITGRQLGYILYSNNLRNGLPRFRFKPGHKSLMKGIGSKYKPGDPRYIPPGTERINSRGYVEVKVEGNDKWEWKPKHRIIWEAANGPVPKSHLVIFADSDKTNFALDNLLLVSRKEIAVMNKHMLIYPDKDSTKAGKIIADIKMQIAERSGKSCRHKPTAQRSRKDEQESRAKADNRRHAGNNLSGKEKAV
jgi:hypothetical protein